jgi:hypothetical protein
MSIDPETSRIFEALQQTGWTGDTAELAAKLKKLSHGLPVQDEFCLLLSWLGQCRLVHGLVQQQYPPISIATYRVPDLFAIFESNAGPIPVLIEVKSAAKNISCRPDYYEALMRYGNLLGIPVLLAWKESRLDIWSLVDISVFAKAQQNFNLSFSAAMQNNLMGLLAGDFLIFFTPGFGMHLHFRKLSPKDENGVHCIVDEAYFLGPGGRRFKILPGGLWPFFMTLDLDSEVEETETHFHQSYIVKERQNSQFAHRGFPALFSTEKVKYWRKLLEEHSFAVLPEDLRQAAREFYEYSATSELMRILPRSIPPYLEKLKPIARTD